jgi:hypothetical protein
LILIVTRRTIEKADGRYVILYEFPYAADAPRSFEPRALAARALAGKVAGRQASVERKHESQPLHRRSSINKTRE